MKFAIVDIETTGLFHQGHGMTEIAIIHFDGQKIEQGFHSLVNPGRNIPKHIRQLTGIADDVVADAPDFDEIADEVFTALEDRVFVAHNVNFDYNFLKAAFAKAGRKFDPRRLCTMRYCRKVLPGLKSYTLQSVCRQLEIHNMDEHRAGGDADATVLVLKKLMKLDQNHHLESLLKSRSGETILPPALSRDAIDALPLTAGVYYFFGESRNPIYVGKAKNLKRRVLSHFTSSSSSGKKQLFQRLVTRIDHKPTSNEYEALLLEDAEIKKWWPRLNRAQKGPVSAYAVIAYETRSGVKKLGIVSTRQRSDALAWFDSLHAAKVWLFKALAEAAINPSIAGMYNPDFVETEDPDQNAKLDAFITELQSRQHDSYLIRKSGRRGAHFAVGIIHGQYRGFGHFSKNDTSLSEVQNRLYLAPDSLVVKAVIRKMLSDQSYEIQKLS